jgi:hypothetical protein
VPCPTDDTPRLNLKCFLVIHAHGPRLVASPAPQPRVFPLVSRISATVNGRHRHLHLKVSFGASRTRAKVNERSFASHCGFREATQTVSKCFPCFCYGHWSQVSHRIVTPRHIHGFQVFSALVLRLTVLVLHRIMVLATLHKRVPFVFLTRATVNGLSLAPYCVLLRYINRFQVFSALVLRLTVLVFALHCGFGNATQTGSMCFPPSWYGQRSQFCTALCSAMQHQRIPSVFRSRTTVNGLSFAPHCVFRDATQTVSMCLPLSCYGQQSQFLHRLVFPRRNTNKFQVIPALATRLTASFYAHLMHTCRILHLATV